MLSPAKLCNSHKFEHNFPTRIRKTPIDYCKASVSWPISTRELSTFSLFEAWQLKATESPRLCVAALLNISFLLRYCPSHTMSKDPFYHGLKESTRLAEICASVYINRWVPTKTRWILNCLPTRKIVSEPLRRLKYSSNENGMYLDKKLQRR